VARTTAISARITGDNTDFKRVLADSDAAAQAWSRRMTSTSTVQVGKGGGGGMAMMQLAQAVDDVQYGMRGVVNNIPGLLMSLGAGAGLAGVVSIAAVAMYQLTTRFGEFVTGAKKAKEASDFVGQMTEKMNAALAQGAKEAADGTKEGAEALREATAAAEDNFKVESTRLQNRIRLAEEAAAAELRLATARIQASNATEEEKAIQMMALREKEAQRAHQANMQRMREERDMLGNRAAAMKEAEFQAARQLNDAQAYYETISRNAGIEGVGANPFLVEQAYNQMEAAAQDYEKAREAAAKANAEAMRQAGQLGTEMNQQQKRLEKEVAAIRLEGQAEVDEAAEKAAAKETARRKKQMDEAQEAAEREVKWRADIEKKIQGERAETARKNEEQKKSLAILQAEAEIARLRAGGRNAGADRRQRELDLQRESERIQQDTGVGADEARRIAEQLNPDPRRAGRINARVRRRPEDEDGQNKRALGQGPFGGLRDRLDREIGQVGLPQRPRGPQDATSREQVTRAPEVAQDSGRTLKEMAKSLEAIQVNTEGLSKKKSEALARA
jgi:hypothetical protein